MTNLSTGAQRYLSDQQSATQRLASFPQSIRDRLEAWQTGQREWFTDTVLEIVSEFIAFEDENRSIKLIELPADAVQRMARGIKASWDEEQFQEARESNGLIDYEPGPWEEWIPQATAALQALGAEHG